MSECTTLGLPCDHVDLTLILLAIAALLVAIFELARAR